MHLEQWLRKIHSNKPFYQLKGNNDSKWHKAPSQKTSKRTSKHKSPKKERIRKQGINEENREIDLTSISESCFMGKFNKIDK